MARVIKSNPLIKQKGSISSIYAEFLRDKNSLCAKSTVNIYKRLGEKFFIPQLSELTGDDMNKVTKETLRTILDDYEADHDEGGKVFIWAHLKSFINWYWQEYEIPTANPTQYIHVRRKEAKPIPGITPEEIDKLLKTAKTHSVFPERDIAMLMILSDTGIRRRSLMELKMSDVDVRNGTIITHEKDQQFHVHSFGSACSKAIVKYLSCLEDVKPTDPFWLTMDGAGLTVYGAKEILRRLCAEANIPMHHFHDFRRFFAKELYKSTRDIYTVSRALQHKGIEVTKRYIDVDDYETAEITRSFSPMDRRLRQTGVKVKRV